MFTGLIETVGIVSTVVGSGAYRRIGVRASFASHLRRGDSVALNGACQTVVAVGSGVFEVEALSETLSKTNLGALTVGARVNLERPLTPTSRFDGHIVQGHVDGTAVLTEVRRAGEGWYLTVSLPPELLSGCIAQGSIAIDGISLTIARLGVNSVTVNIIPTTWRETTLADRSTGDALNIELDVIGRYVRRFLETGGRSRLPGATAATLTPARLAQLGYGGPR